MSLTDEAASVLNQAFGVNAFEGGFNIGMAEVDALFSANGNIFDRRLGDLILRLIQPNQLLRPIRIS
ncbi:MAG: hypothetical protein AAF327_23810 [Cyanobacteria bacterium P01_A01_bin.37]